MKYQPWEEESLLLQVCVQALHDGVQEAVGVMETIQQARQGGRLEDLTTPTQTRLKSQRNAFCVFVGRTDVPLRGSYPGILDAVPHDLPPVAVHRLEESALLRHLLHDVRRGEDGLQVEPLGLHLQPLVDGLLDADQPLLPQLDGRWRGHEQQQHELRQIFNGTVECVCVCGWSMAGFKAASASLSQS